MLEYEENIRIDDMKAANIIKELAGVKTSKQL
jgi:hypothetical protein